MDDWKIEKRKGACDRCAKALAPEAEYVAALRDEGARFARREFCSPCWPAETASAYYSYWKTRVPPPDAPRRANLDAAFETFDKLLAEASPDPSRRRLAFLLSLLLLQRRRLKLLATETRDGVEVLRLERLDDRRQVEVVNPGVPDAELDGLKAEMDALLQ